MDLRGKGGISMAEGGPGVKEIFAVALERRDGPDRDQYLAIACGGDNAVNDRVRALLAAYERAAEVLGPGDTTPAGSEIPTLPDDATAAVMPANPLDPTATGVTANMPKAVRRQADDNADGGDGLRPPAAGDEIRYFGDYRIRRELGRGGMGVVYEATQVSLNRPVALKMVKAGLLAGADECADSKTKPMRSHSWTIRASYRSTRSALSRAILLQHEARAGRQPGRGLAAYQADPRRPRFLAAETAEAIAHAHARGILHRDLKPANILVDDRGHPHITDFGLAKRIEADVEMTVSGAILGTPSYMAPEQARGVRGGITTATDVYGLGSVLYALLTGKPPFGGESVVQTLDAVRHDRPERPAKINDKTPRDLETICLKCLEKDPRHRYPTAQALADDLRAWLDARPISARRVGEAERAWLWCRRRPAVAALSAAVLVASLIGTATVITVQRRANRRLTEHNAALAASLRREEQARNALAAANKRVEERITWPSTRSRRFTPASAKTSC